jgi:NADH-quinone oxidoreductase subunit G/[NiFe] hydrogenase diaphorase moiety small subunit
MQTPLSGIIYKDGQNDENHADLITVLIDDREIEVERGTTILEAAKKLGIFIPTLCHHPDLHPQGACRLCIVEVDGEETLRASCEYRITRPVSILTHTPRVVRTRQEVVDMMFINHYGFWDHYNCPRVDNCELQSNSGYGCSPMHYGITKQEQPVDDSSVSIVRDMNYCIMCLRCVQTCREIQGVNCLELMGTGKEMKIATFNDMPLNSAVCINCGQCAEHCPTAALHSVDSTDKVLQWIADPQKHVVIQTAPAPRAAIGECFDQEPGQAYTFELNTALRQAGFDRVFDTNFSADLTILEEGTELLKRLHSALVEKNESAALPMFTSCSPGWIKFIEHFYPEYLPNLSTAKSPQQMFGAAIKTYYAQEAGINPEDIVTVSLMPCTAKKFECNRPEMNASGYKDVDYVITTREMAGMLKKLRINLPDLEKSGFDEPFGTATGSGVIFGATGGVMESALRTVIDLVTGEPVENLFTHADIEPVRGMDGVKMAEVTFQSTGPVPALLQNHFSSWEWLKGVTLKVAVVHGTANAREVLENIKIGGELASCHFIEFMACEGGCLGGGGQPIPTTPEIRKARTQAIYKEDSGSEIRKSYENPAVARIYSEFLTEGPGGQRSHHLLHTRYVNRKD